MINQYVGAVYKALGSVLDHITRLTLPLAICAGLVVVAGAVILVFQKDSHWLQRTDWRRHGAGIVGVVVIALLIITGWAMLRTVQPLAEQDLRWREAAEATSNPVPDAPQVVQSGPAVAAIVERTYERTLTLPPDFLTRIGEQGVGVLSPYLSDPSAQNVLKLVDTFRRSGQDVVFTRQMTRLDEEPISFSTSQLRVKFRRLPGRAYDADFEAHYAFQNPRTETSKVRFLFTLPEAGTVRDLNVTVGGDVVTEPSGGHVYEWSGQMEPNETREAIVRYRVLGARTWQYDLGSQRRRVQQFRLSAVTSGPVRFLRGSLQPTSNGGSNLGWELANVVTAQQVAMVFPPDTEGRDSFLQALSALPASLILFVVGAFAVAWQFRLRLDVARLAGGLALFGLGLAASGVIANYLGPVAGVVVGPLAGAAMCVKVMGRPFILAAVPAALLPAAFLSAHHSGLLVLLLVAVTLAGVLLAPRPRGLVLG